MGISILSILFLLIFSSAKNYSIVILNPVVSEGVEDELVKTFVEITIKKLKRAEYKVMEVEERDMFFENIGIIPYVVDEKLLDIMNKHEVEWIIGGSIIRRGEGYFLTVERWDTEEKERVSYSEWFESDIALLNSIEEVLKALGMYEKPEGTSSPEEVFQKHTVIEYQEPKKVSVPGAFLLSIFPGFGTGHFYAHNRSLGTLFMIGEGGSILAFYIGVVSAEDLDALVWVGISTISFLVFKMAEVLSSIPVAISYNRSIEKREGYFYPFFIKNGEGFGIGVRF